MIVVPQWQGSGAAQAHRLVRGAQLLAELIPARRRIDVAVDEAPGELRDGVRSLDALVRHARAVAAALDGLPAGKPAIAVGGDCSIDLMPIARAAARHGERLAVVWLDAHGDLNTPESSPSHAFHGMVLRTLLGEGPPALRPPATLRPHQVVLAGARALDAPEEDVIRERRIRRVTVDELRDPGTLVDAVAATGASAVYVHFDLDVLDPETFSSVGYPEPGGVSPALAAAAVSALAARFELAGLAITELQAAGTDEERAVLRDLIGALPIGR